MNTKTENQINISSFQEDMANTQTENLTMPEHIGKMYDIVFDGIKTVVLYNSADDDADFKTDGENKL